MSEKDDIQGLDTRVEVVLDKLMKDRRTQGIAKRHGLIGADDEDVFHEARSSLAQRWEHNPPKRKELLAMPESGLRNYLIRCLHNAAETIARKGKRDKRTELSPEQLELIPAKGFSPLDIAAAREIISQVRANLEDEHGLFALRVALSGGRTPAELAPEYGVTERTANRWYAVGIKLVSMAIKRVLAREYGDTALREFCRGVCIYQDAQAEIEVRRFLKRGDLPYRSKLVKLSPEARRLVFFFEAGTSSDDIIEDIAWRRYDVDRASFPTRDELRAAKAEFMHLIKEIREILDS